MKTDFKRILGIAAVAAGLTFAQTPAPAPAPADGQQGQHHQWRGRMGGGHMGQRMSAYLNLTDAQKEQAKQIFKAAADQAQPIRQQMRDVRKQLTEAVKANAPSDQVDKLAAQIGDLTAQITAIHTKAFAQFYSGLNPDQKTKLDSRMERFLNGQMRPAAFRGRPMKGQSQVSQ